MSKIDNLINQLCPNGVEYMELSEILKIKNGKDYKGYSNGNIPVYGSGGIIAYINKFAFDKPSVLIPRKGSIDKLYYVDKPFWNVDTIFYTDINTTKAIPRYVYHCLLKEHLEQYNTAGGVPSLTQKVLNKVKIPVPPVEIQLEIVHILDKYSEKNEKLIKELYAETELRKKQYSYYRDMLLDFGDDVEWKTLGEITVKISSGKNKEKNQEGAYPVYGSTGIIAYCEKYEYDKKQILIARVGANAGYVHIAEEKYDVSDNTIMLNVKDTVLFKYIYYLLINMNLNKYAKGGGQPLVTAGQIKEIKIPVPPIEQQERIVKILDRFDTLCNDLTSELPAEIKARQKQYEYYRNKLLQFKIKNS